MYALLGTWKILQNMFRELMTLRWSLLMKPTASVTRTLKIMSSWKIFPAIRLSFCWQQRPSITVRQISSHCSSFLLRRKNPRSHWRTTLFPASRLIKMLLRNFLTSVDMQTPRTQTIRGELKPIMKPFLVNPLSTFLRWKSVRKIWLLRSVMSSSQLQSGATDWTCRITLLTETR